MAAGADQDSHLSPETEGINGQFHFTVVGKQVDRNTTITFIVERGIRV